MGRKELKERAVRPRLFVATKRKIPCEGCRFASIDEASSYLRYLNGPRALERCWRMLVRCGPACAAFKAPLRHAAHRNSTADGDALQSALVNNLQCHCKAPCSLLLRWL